MGPDHGGNDAQSISNRLGVRCLIVQTGSGRPEKISAPAVHPVTCLLDFDMAMHNHHKRAKICVGTSVGGSWI